MGRTTVRGKLKKAVAEIGGEMKRVSTGLYLVDYDKMDYFFEIDEKDGSFCIVQNILGLEKPLTKDQCETVIDVMANFHKDYGGEWNGEVSYVYSPWYCLKDVPELGGTELKKIIDDFFEAWSFASLNACILTDPTMLAGL